MLVGLAAFALRFAGGAVQVRRGDFLQFDGHDYNDLAVNLAAGRGYLVERVRWFECPRDVPAPDFSRPPLAPMIVAAFYTLYTLREQLTSGIKKGFQEIGAGGGSIAKVSRMGTLQVGPESSGADPGPLCDQRGGTEPGVTDADLLLGYLD